MAAGRFKVLAAMVAVMVMMVASAAFAQEKPKIAVYVKGAIDDGMKSALCNELLFAIAKNERYRPVHDNGEFIAAVKSEMERHGVSEMSDMQIGKAGEHVNADFVCVANVSPVLGGYSVLARIIDVKNEAVAEMGRAAGTIASAADVSETADRIAASMFGVSGEAAPQVQAAVPAQEITQEQQAAAETPAPLPKGPIKAAVYVTGVPDLVGKTLNSAISSALIKSKVYAGIESINVSGAPNVPALADAGRNAGVSYIFAINVAGQISVAIIDVAGTVELAKISIDGKITALNAAAIAKKIVDFILTSGPKPDPDALVADETAPVQPVVGYESDSKPRVLQNRISIELDYGGGYGSYRYSYVDTISPKRTVRESGSVVGSGYFRFDSKYFEYYQDMAVLIDPDSVYMPVVFGYLGKYPLVFDQVPVKVTPIWGFGCIVIDVKEFTISGGFIFGGRIDVGISKIAYMRSEYLYFSGAGNGMSLKAGGGLDMGLGKKKKAFWRTELMYNWLSAYNPEYKYRVRVYDEYEHRYNYEYQHRVDVKNSIHYVDIRTGIGYKWGGVKKEKVPK